MITHSRVDSQPIAVNLESTMHYGVMLSGGLDSAVLLCLMLEDCKQKGIVPAIQPFTIPKHDGASLYIASIIDYANRRYNVKLPDTILVGNPDAYHRYQSTTAFNEIFEKYKSIDIVFSGINQNPPPEFSLSGTYPIRDKKSTNPKIIVPFVNLYKTHILDLLYEYNLEKLIDITHSCTMQKVGRCGQCFQCNERQWAFEQLNHIDTGVL